MLAIPITAIYLVETLFIMFVYDAATIVQSKKIYILELVCQACSIAAFIKIYTYSDQETYAEGVSLLCFAFLIRNLRISFLLEEIKSFKIIMTMLMKMTVPLLYQLACLYIVFYIFSILGIYGLGGLIVQPNFHSEAGIGNNLYYLVNFNDLGTSITTLYAFMIINNWPAMTDMMVNVAGSVWPRIYFMVFYIIVQWIVLNIVIAMMLDIFTNVDSELDVEFERRERIYKLMEKQKRMGRERFARFCDEVNEKLCREEVDRVELEKRAHGIRQDKVSHSHTKFFF